MSSRTQAEPVHRVAVVAFDGISPFHLSGPCMVLGPDMAGPGMPPFRLQVCASEAGPLRTTAGFTIAATHRLPALAPAGAGVVPSWRDTTEPVPPALLQALRRAHARGARIVGPPERALALPHAGLLARRPPTTHW